MTAQAQAFAVGDRVEIVGPTTIGSLLRYPHAGLGRVLEITPAGIAYVEDDTSRCTFHFPFSSLCPVPQPAPDTEDTLSLILAELRTISTRLDQRPRPMNLHGVNEDCADEVYSLKTVNRVNLRDQRVQGPKGEM